MLAIEPTEPTEPTDPIEPSEPTEAMHAIDPTEATEQMEPTEATDDVDERTCPLSRRSRGGSSSSICLRAARKVISASVLSRRARPSTCVA